MKTRLSFVILLAALAAISCNQPPPSPEPMPLDETSVIAQQVAANPRLAMALAWEQRTKEETAARNKRIAEHVAGPVVPLDVQRSSLLKYQQSASIALPKAGTFAASPSTVYPKAWSVTDWYWDDQNFTHLASDNNDCQTATTPCLTFNEIVYHRWGTTQPVLGGNQGSAFFTVIGHPLSAWTTGFDGVQADPLAGFFELIGPLSAVNQVATGTLASVIQKTISLPTPNLLTATLTAGLTAGQLIHNTTHDSYAWTKVNTSGNVWTISQPEVLDGGTEVNTWSNGDTFIVYAPVFMVANTIGHLVDLVNVRIDGSVSGNGVFIFASQAVVQSVILTFATWRGPTLVVSNCDIPVNTFFLPNVDVTVIAGQYRGANNMQGKFSLQQDFVNAGTANGTFLYDNSVVQTVWTESAPLVASGTVSMTGSAGVGTGYITGTGETDAVYGGQWNYGVGFNTAAQAFRSSAANPLGLGGRGTTGILHVAYTNFLSGNTVTVCGGIALTPANLDAASSATCSSSGLGGIAYQPAGGGSFNKY